MSTGMLAPDGRYTFGMLMVAGPEPATAVVTEVAEAQVLAATAVA
jgi:hypothetical protein